MNWTVPVSDQTDLCQNGTEDSQGWYEYRGSAKFILRLESSEIKIVTNDKNVFAGRQPYILAKLWEP